MRRIHEADVNKVIKDLQGDFGGDNESQMRGVQLLKGLATSDDPKANEFMKKLNTATTKISKEVLEERVPIDKTRVKEAVEFVGDVRAEPIRIPAKVLKEGRRRVQMILNRNYFPEIPLGPIFETLEEIGIYVVQEDGTRWEGFLLGEEGSATMDLMYEGRPVSNSMLAIQWYKMPSGRQYEVNGYLS